MAGIDRDAVGKLLCVLLFRVFVWQGAVVQTHNHFDRGVVLGAADAGWTGVSKGSGSPGARGFSDELSDL